MNQILLGAGAGLDTDHVQYWEMRDDESPTFAGTEGGPQTRVQFKNGKEAILRGEAKAAFDEWAAGREGGEPVENLCSTCDRRVGGAMGTVCEQPLIGYPGCYKVLEESGQIPCCQTCVYHDWKIGPCQAPKGSDAFPECWDGGDSDHHHYHTHGSGSVPHSHGHPVFTGHHSADEADPLHEETKAREQIIGSPLPYALHRCGNCEWWRTVPPDLSDAPLRTLCVREGLSPEEKRHVGKLSCGFWKLREAPKPGKPERPFWENCVGCSHWHVAENRCQEAMEPWLDCPRVVEDQPIENMGGEHSVANCKLCADYNPATDHCTREDTTKGWPGCWRGRDEDAVLNPTSAYPDCSEDVVRQANLCCHTCGWYGGSNTDKPARCMLRPSTKAPYPECHEYLEPGKQPLWHLRGGETIVERTKPTPKTKPPSPHMHWHEHVNGMDQHLHEHAYGEHHDAAEREP